MGPTPTAFDRDLLDQEKILTDVPSPSAEPDATTPRRAMKRASFHGVGGTLLGMQIVNVCLTIVTLGGYHFWAKAKIRR